MTDEQRASIINAIAVLQSAKATFSAMRDRPRYAEAVSAIAALERAINVDFQERMKQ